MEFYTTRQGNSMVSSSGNLGRGLNDLLGDAAASESKTFFESSTHRFTPVFIDRVDAPSPPPIPSAQLVESVRRHGLFCPVVVRKTGDRFTLIAGEERLCAALDVGLREVPACVVELDEVAAAELAQAEADQHPAPNTKALYREWMNSLALNIGCNADELNRKLKAFRGPSRHHPRYTIIGSAMSAAVVLLLLWWGMSQLSPLETSPATPFVEKTFAPHDSEMHAMTNANDIKAQATKHGAIHTAADPKLPAVTDESEPAPESHADIAQEKMPSDSIELVDPHSNLSWLDTARIDGIRIASGENGDRLIFDAPVFRYQDFIDPAAKDRLLKLGQELAEAPEGMLLVITGHTDNDPVSSRGAYMDNYQIGMARAVAVTDFLVRDAGLPRGQVLATSAGEYQPPFPNEPPSEKRKNRTVTFLLRNR